MNSSVIIGVICLLIAVVSQAYSVHLVEENVLRGNAAIIKCLIPSFVTEYVSVSSWIMSEGDVETEIKLNDTVNKEGILHLLRCSFLQSPMQSSSSYLFHPFKVVYDFIYSSDTSLYSEPHGGKRIAWKCRYFEMSHFNFRHRICQCFILDYL